MGALHLVEERCEDSIDGPSMLILSSTPGVVALSSNSSPCDHSEECWVRPKSRVGYELEEEEAFRLEEKGEDVQIEEELDIQIQPEEKKQSSMYMDKEL